MQQERPGAPLPFEACENFRELGGYTGCGGRHVKYGAFYRSPALANIKTPADRARFEALGVRTVFDFRSEKERTLAPDPAFPGVVNIPASAMLAEDGSEMDFDLESALDAIEEKYPSFEEYLRAEFEIGAAELEDIRARYLV